MASIKQHKDKWRAFVQKNGIKKSKVFAVKAKAAAWAAAMEAEIEASKSGELPNKTFACLLERYRDEVSVTKKGERWERLRIGTTLRDPIALAKLKALDAKEVAAWRDRRLAQVSPASVQREWNLLSNACSVAVKEWRWLKENPFRDVRRPPATPHRDRLASDAEIDSLLFVLGYSRDSAPETASARVGAAMLFAIETAMRAGEICALRWSDIEVGRRFLRVTGMMPGGGKTAAARRQVPLSSEAIRILQQLPELEPVFGLATSQIDALFRKAKSRALIDDLHFHDFRHTAITRLAKKLDVLALARMVGHRDLRQLMIYYNPTAEELAGRL